MKFSITIPAYKSKFLYDAISSILYQTYNDWELIIVDDCSPENLYDITAPFLRDSRVRYYRNEQNCGAINVVDNWNKCLSYCTGDYVICMGDDDLLLPCCLETYKDLIEKYPDLYVYHSRAEIIDECGKLMTLQEPRPEWESVVSLIWNRWSSRHLQFIGDFCYSVTYLKSVGGYYKLPLAWGSDDITAILASRERGIANTQVIGFQYRQNSQTITSSKGNSKLKILTRLEQLRFYRTFLDEMAQQSNLSEIDVKYLKTIENVKSKYFFGALDNDCPNFIKGNPLRLLWCYRTLKPLSYSIGTYIKWYIKSIM